MFSIHWVLFHSNYFPSASFRFQLKFIPSITLFSSCFKVDFHRFWIVVEIISPIKSKWHFQNKNSPIYSAKNVVASNRIATPFTTLRFSVKGFQWAVLGCLPFIKLKLIRLFSFLLLTFCSLTDSIIGLTLKSPIEFWNSAYPVLFAQFASHWFSSWWFSSHRWPTMFVHKLQRSYF
jgi:hypothetical protein